MTTDESKEFPQTAKEHYNEAMRLLALPDWLLSAPTVLRVQTHLQAARMLNYFPDFADDK